MVIEGVKDQWAELFTDEMMDIKHLREEKNKFPMPSIQKFILDKCEEDYKRYQEQKILLEVRGDSFFNHPYRISGRIEKVNYNATMILLHKEDGGYALIDIMMIRKINPCD